ncbi:MAG: hypothetical protein HFI48_12890 [Lachnospiraceae bacterium]|nr:hypothetical protein [Lachnospiraceae bacterium]
MKIDVKELQDAVNSIQITDRMQAEMVQNVKAAVKEHSENVSAEGKKYKISKRGLIRRFHPARAAAVIAAVIAVSGFLSIPVRAIVNSLIQERMEKEPAEEMEKIVEDMEGQRVSADSFSREFTEEERRRIKELAEQYQAGTFPAGELFMAQSVEEAENCGFCFLVTNAVFYLPERVLTDEELLEIIDFYVKREYAVRQRSEEMSAEESAIQKEQQIEEAVQTGGVTEEEAIAIAADYLEKIFGITGEGLEHNHYYEEEVVINGESGLYHVNWTNFLSRKYYYFYISPDDGSLVEVIYNADESFPDRGPAPGEAETRIPEMKQKAVSFIEEVLAFSYEDIYYVYYRTDDSLCSYIDFMFVQDDKTYVLEYTWDGIFRRVSKGTFTTYEQEYERIKENAAVIEACQGGSASGERKDAEVTLFMEKAE